MGIDIEDNALEFFLGKKLVIDFITVKETKHGLERKARVKFEVQCEDTLLHFITELRRTELLSDNTGIPFSSEDKQDLLEIIWFHLIEMPVENGSNHFFVCIVASETDDKSGVIIKFKLITGIHVDDDEAISWDSFEEPFDQVLQACKPPIPGLKKTKIDNNLGSEECAICLKRLLIRSEAACTTCSHVYHSHCIIKWLIRSPSCPLCRYCLPIGWF